MATFFSGYFLAKVAITALAVAGISTLARQASLLAAVLASLPLTTILALVWMRMENQPATNMISLSEQVFWLVLPSLAFFLVFPMLLRIDLSFYTALLTASAITALAYGLMLKLLGWFGSPL